MTTFTTIGAKTYFVDRNHASANDSNPGTQELPWKTIQHAAETLIAGDTVYIRAGTYNEHIYIEHDGNATDYIVFSAYPGETPVLDGTGVTETQNGVIVDKSYLKLIGLEIQNWNDNAIWIENASFLEISDCIVHHVYCGIGVAYGTHDFVFDRVEAHHFDLYGFDASPSGGADCYNGTFNECISHTGRDSEQNVDGFALGHGTQHDFVLNHCIAYNVYDGFDISSRNTTLNGCLAYDCWNGAYKLWNYGIKLVNCIGYDCTSSVLELDWDGVPGKSSLFNCTFFHGETYTIWIENKADTLELYNCILAGGDNIGLAFQQMGTGNYRGDYNLFHNANSNRAVAVAYTDEFTLDQLAAGDWTAYSGQDAHSLVAYSDTTLFVDPNGLDLHLRPTSPAVDHGTDSGAPSEDYDGNPRPSGTGYDIGAYEVQEGTRVLNFHHGNSAESCKLYQNYPNPFNSATTIHCKIPASGKGPVKAELRIYNVQGRLIRTLAVKENSAGMYQFHWDGLDEWRTDVAAGIYLYRIQTDHFSTIKKMILIK